MSAGDEQSAGANAQRFRNVIDIKGFNRVFMIACVILVSTPGAAEIVGQDDPSGHRRAQQIPAAGPISCWEILGPSVLERTIVRLQRAGLKAITVVAEDQWSFLLPPSTRQTRVNLAAQPTSLWSTARRAVKECLQQGADTVLLLKIGPYAEFDIADLVRFHRAKNQSLTPIANPRGSLAGWILGADQVRKAGMAGCEDIVEARCMHAAPYVLQGYVNDLRDARDYRRLVADALLSRCAMRPAGYEVKPGVWIGDGARVHRRARIIAPAYVGRGTKVREGVLISRFTNLEGGCEVDRDTLVKTSSALPNTYLGKGLILCHAVVDGCNILHLQHNTVVEITDANLLARAIPSKRSCPSPDSGTNSGVTERFLETAWSQVGSFIF